MNLATLPQYLIGRRDAILQIAQSRHAVWVGLLFVLSAGFAREYDGEDLLHEPWHLLLPLAASLGTSALLYGMCYLAALRRSPTRPAFFSGYVSFLALYWMTAPLAWLYAIPWERYRSPAEAVKLNLLTLGLVSAWRVLLMIRVTRVFFGFNYFAAVMAVMLFADVVAMSLLAMTPLPVISIMGGVRLTESEAILSGVVIYVRLAGTLTFPIWLLGFAGILIFPPDVEQVSRPVRAIWEEQGERTWGSVLHVSLPVWIFAGLTLLAGISLLPLAQREQQLRRQVETALRSGDVQQGIELISRHQRSDFPPHWDPPPRIGYRERTPPMIDVLEALAQTDAPDWVRATFIDKILLQSPSRHHGEFTMLLGSSVLPHPRTLDNAGLARYVGILRRLPEGPAIAAAQRKAVEQAIERPGDDQPLTPQRKELLEAVLKLAGPDERD